MTGIRIAFASLLLATAPLAAQGPAPVQQVLLYSYGYNPAPLHLAAGRPVTLVFVNRRGKGHNFTAPTFFRASRILSGHIEGGGVDLRGGQSASVTLVPAAGRYKVHCGHFMHSQLGMTEIIIVD